jgi:hypothetical protein
MSTALSLEQPRVPHSLHVTAALTWRYARLALSGFLALVGIFCLVPSLLLELIRLAHPGTVAEITSRLVTEVALSLRRLLVVGETLALPALLLCVGSQIRPLYRFPVTSSRIVQTQLLLGIAAAMLVHALVVVYYRAAYDAPIPLLAPLGVICPMVVILSALWALLQDFCWWRILLGVTGGAVLVGYIGSRMEFSWVVQDPSYWFRPTVPELGVLLSLAAVAWGFVEETVRRDRCGDLRPWPDLNVWLNRLAHATMQRLWPGRSAALWTTGPIGANGGLRAQFWFEFWQRGLVLPLVAVVFGGGSLVVCLIASGSTQGWLTEFLLAVPGLWGFGLVGCGFVLGFVNLGRHHALMDAYRATRPLSDADMAWTVLRVAAGSALMAAAVGFVLAGSASLIDQLFARTPLQLSDLRWPSLGTLTGLPAAVVCLLLTTLIGGTLLGLAASLVLAGRWWLVMLVYVGSVGGLLFNAVLPQLAGDDVASDVRVGLVALLAAACVMGTIWTHASARRHGLIPDSIRPLGLLTWAVSAAVLLGTLWFTGLAVDVPGRLVLIVAVTSLSAAPLACAPLALFWNRHR